MQINSLYAYTPYNRNGLKPAKQNFRASAQELNELWEDNESNSHLWNRFNDDYNMVGDRFVLPPTIKIHQTWDETNGFKNLKSADSVNKIYTGYTLVKTPEKIKELKDIYGVKTIVDLVGYNEYKRQCKEAGVNYFGDFNLYYNMFGTAPFQSQEDYFALNAGKGSKAELIEQHKNKTLEFNKNLNKLIDILDGGHVYMGCDHGHSRTNDTILLINEYTNSQKLNLNEEDIMNIDEKKRAIRQFKENLKLYSEN